MNYDKEYYKAKHFSQMKIEERLHLMNKKDSLLNSGKTIFSPHMLDQMELRRVKKRDIIKAIRTGQILEYRKIFRNNKYIDDRITIRATHLNRRYFQVVVVFSLKNNVIITTYYNNIREIYEEKNFSKYDKFLTVLKA